MQNISRDSGPGTIEMNYMYHKLYVSQMNYMYHKNKSNYYFGGDI